MEHITRQRRLPGGTLAATARLALLPICLLLGNGVRAEPAWHDYSLRAYFGYLDSVATLDARGPHGALDLGSGPEYGAAFTTVLSPRLDVDFAVGLAEASGTQQYEAGAGRAVDLKQTSLALTGKWRWNSDRALLVPWLGAGPFAALVTTRESTTPGTGSTRNTGGAAGLCGAAGFDLYPVRTSALAFTLEARYRVGIPLGDFEGDTGGLAVLAGLKWDFSPRMGP